MDEILNELERLLERVEFSKDLPGYARGKYLSVFVSIPSRAHVADDEEGNYFKPTLSLFPMTEAATTWLREQAGSLKLQVVQKRDGGVVGTGPEGVLSKEWGMTFDELHRELAYGVRTIG